MSAPNPQVSVFHFTSRISSAKIRKYKLATERGMSSGGGNATTATSASSTLQAKPSSSLEPSLMEPPAKRPKLKLNVRRPSETPDTIAVSRPKRDTSLRIRYSENMVIDSKDLDESDLQRKSRPSPAASSDLSSLTSAPSIEKEPPPAKAPALSSAKHRDYSKDFMSYYVAGGDDDEEDKEIEVIQSQPATTKQDLPKQAPAPAVHDLPIKERRSKYQQPPTYPAAKMEPPRAPPQPVVQVIDSTQKSTGPRDPDTVATMVKKLETLSTALTNFGGIPAVPASPQDDSKLSPEPPLAGEKKDVDNFLAMFDDDDSDDKDGDDTKGGKTTQCLDYKLQNPGELDSPLTYGIVFIQNALRSWAVQRTVAQYNQQYFHYHQSRNDAQTKRGPGRPRKFDSVDDDLRPPSPQAHIKIDLAKTPEGAAISAFQDVIDAGCLQVNTILPVRLTSALRRLYMQIDHLINQGSRNEPPWQCVSYGAQIAAQKIRVEKWKVAHAKAQEEMARQQQLAQQHVMQQMGIPHHQHNITVEQAQQQHAIDLERKRSLQHAAQQPHLTQYLTNPLRLNSSPAGAGTQTAASASPVNIVSASSPGLGAGKREETSPHGLPTQSGSADGKDVRLDKIKLYMPNFLPRSGQSMKFSFAPHNELALHTFGAQAFPTNQTGPNLPNRGPMSAHPPMPMNHAQMPNGSLPMPVVPSNAPRAPVSRDTDVEMMDATNPSNAGVTTRTSAGNLQPVSSNGHLSPREREMKFSTTTDISGDRLNSMPATSYNAASPAKQMSNGLHASIATLPDDTNSTVTEGPKAAALATGHSHPEVMVIDE